MRALLIFAVAIAAIFVFTILLGADVPGGEPTWVEYTVEKGDTLYSIAEQFGASDWRRWSYEVCEVNGIKEGGMLHPGDVILVCREVK